MLPDTDTYLAQVEERFAASTDFTIGLEEEYQILDSGSLALTDGFELLRDSAPDELREHILGELISSEIEVATPRCETFGEAARDVVARRLALFAHAREQGYTLGATGTHAFSPWQDQRIIDTPHYHAVEEKLKYVAWRNNTWSQHIHIGVRGIDRAIAVCDAMRGFLPHLLALSANSPCIDGVWTHLHSARTQTFVRMFPRCGIPDIFGSWAVQRRYFELLFATDSIQEFTPESGGACARTTPTARSRCASATCRANPGRRWPCTPWPSRSWRRWPTWSTRAAPCRCASRA